MKDGAMTAVYLSFPWWLGFNMSVAVAVGFIALAGVAAETGVIMLIYLDQALQEVKAERGAAGLAFTKADLKEAITLGAVERVHPKMMTVVAIMAGLLPILWSRGTGSEVMQRIAVPIIGGMGVLDRADTRRHTRSTRDIGFRADRSVLSSAELTPVEERWAAE